MKSSSRSSNFLAAFTFLLSLAAAASGATLTVNSTSDDGNGMCTSSKCTLRDAVLNVAPAFDEIDFSLPANSTITLTNGQIVIDKSVAIKGPGANLLTVQRSAAAGTANFRVFSVESNSAVQISGLTISNGKITGANGGAISNAGTGELDLTNVIITGNSASLGAGIYSTGVIVANNTAISGNTAGFTAGGVYSTGLTILINCTVSGNTAGFDTGGIATAGSGAMLQLRNSTVSGNTGGISSQGTLTATQSTISGNTSNGGRGAGIDVESGTATLTSCTISNNTLNGGSTGGGGGLGVFNGSTVNLKNTIIAKNTAPTGPDLAGPITSKGYNLIGNSKDAPAITKATGDQIGIDSAQIDPKLGPLHDNGGPTQTQALLPGSPAIDKGDSSGTKPNTGEPFTTDQRGFALPVDSPLINNASDGSDIGAYEVQPDQLDGCSEINLVVNSNADSGAGTLRSIILSACGGSTITFANTVRGAITLASGGELLVDKNLAITGPGANLLAVQRSTVSGTANFRIFDISKANTRVSISGLTIANGVGQLGGGIYNTGTLAISNATIRANTAINGGGIHNDFGTLEVTNSTLSDNTVSSGTAAGSGGGIFNRGGKVTLSNSTVSKNTAIGPGKNSDSGGGINSNVGSVTLFNCTITGNSADFGGGVRAMNGAVARLGNTIMALNNSPSGPDGNGDFTSSGFTLVGNNDGMTMPQTGYDQIGTPLSPVDPKLGGLGDNGGPTFTHALLPGSPAIDKGVNISSSPTDQRGFPRPSDDPNIMNPIPGDGSDIGSYELQIPSPTPTPTATPSPTPGLVGNVSTRLPVGTGDNVLIEGFIVQGPAGSTKTIIVRAIGPSLIPFGIQDALANPTLEIHDSTNAIVATNDDWKTTQQGGLITSDQSAAITASQVAPSNDLESAIIADLAPGSYTAVVRGLGNTTGTGLVDAYDLSAGSPAKLANIATRGLIQPGDKLMIAGFIIQNGSVKAVVRAIGPSLSAFGITNALPDTTLQLRDQNGNIVLENDDWQTTQKQELENTGLQPSDPKEAAVVATLQPGQYTVEVRGNPETTGIGVVQVYFLQ
jgi:hypothetical protein